MVGFEENAVVEWMLALMGIAVWGFTLVRWLSSAKGITDDEYATSGLSFLRLEKSGLLICDWDDLFSSFAVDFSVEL